MQHAVITRGQETQMAYQTFLPPIHGLVRLKRDTTSPLGVVAAGPEDRVITQPSELPEHLIELHLFENQQAAHAYCLGIEDSGVQSMQAVQLGRFSSLVLLARFSLQRPSMDNLEECVVLVAHTSVQSAVEQVIHEDTYAKKMVAKRKQTASWSDVAAVLERLPPKREKALEEMEWHMARIVIVNPELVYISGTLKSNPVATDINGGMYIEHRVSLNRLPDNSVIAEVQVDSPRQNAVWRNPEAIAAMTAFGWKSGSDVLFRPQWHGDMQRDELMFQKALLNVPAMAAELGQIAIEANAVDSAVRLSRIKGMPALLADFAAYPTSCIVMGLMDGSNRFYIVLPDGREREFSARQGMYLMDNSIVHRSGMLSSKLTDFGLEQSRNHQALVEDAVSHGYQSPVFQASTRTEENLQAGSRNPGR